MAFGPGDHFWALCVFFFRISRLLKECNPFRPAKDWDRYPPPVPADEMLFNQLIGYAAGVQILADSLRKICMELPGQVHEIFILVNHPASIAIECSKKRIKNWPGWIYF